MKIRFFISHQTENPQPVDYLKKPYTIPAEFEKCKGSLYMRENLVSWQIEKEDGKLDYTYYRAVYKKPHGELIKREEAKPVYPTEKNNA